VSCARISAQGRTPSPSMRSSTKYGVLVGNFLIARWLSAIRSIGRCRCRAVVVVGTSGCWHRMRTFAPGHPASRVPRVT
jgi:hypothetical protein